MLVGLSVRDIALIDRLDLKLHSGLCVLTGETGAGKSILLDALGLALGRRAEAGLVRPGVAQGAAVAAFAVGADHPAAVIAREHGIDLGGNAAPKGKLGAPGGELVLRRVAAVDGRSRAFINDEPVSVALLRKVGEALVEVHGQSDEIGLLDTATHRALLDSYGGLGAAAALVADRYRAWREMTAAVERASAERDRIAAEAEELRRAVAELTLLAPKPDEETELAGQRALLQHAGKLVGALDEAIAALEESGGIANRLHRAMKSLERVADRAEGRLNEPIQILRRALTETDEAGAALAAVARTLDLDPSRLDQIEERLFGLRAMARKYGVPVGELAALGQRSAERLAAIGADAVALAERRRALAEARQAYIAAAEDLRRQRVAAAARLGDAVARELAPLQLGAARFAVRLLPLEEDEWGPGGLDKLMFQVAMNPGLPLAPLAKVASGGELSRLMLALKVVLAGQGQAATLIFDEVDRGLGGATASAVGDRLARLAETVQVLVVTHAPQVAARGGHHWKISKRGRGQGQAATTVTRVAYLDPVGRREEIARMLAGAKVTNEARAAALSLMRG
jgi:DNA repair protein RecN (Recombination protein N)